MADQSSIATLHDSSEKAPDTSNGQDVQALRIDTSTSPFDWPVRKKWNVTLIACYVTFIVGINSTSITAAATPINHEFNVSDATFPNSFWPVTAWNGGAALAPMVILPIMESCGMRIGYIITYALFTIFVIPQAFAQNFATLIITRFFAGCCGGVLQDVMDGIIADVWNDSFQRSLPVTIYVFSLLLGVTVGPVIGGAVTTSLDWRWMFYIQLILYGISAPIVLATFKETRGPVIARKSSPQQARIDADILRPISKHQLKHVIWDTVGRPTYLLVTEPVVFWFTLLSALSYVLVFIATQSVTQVFSTLYSFSEPTTGLVQASIAIGEVLGFLACLPQNHYYHLKAHATPSATIKTPVPETRLYIAIIGTFAGLAAGLFIYAWTSYPYIPWIVPCIGLALTGLGSVTTMQAIMVYVTDSYAKYAASASAAVCFGENIFAAFLPLASKSLYSTLGFQWASSLLGFVAVVLGFAPVALLFCGDKVRSRSKFMEAATYD